MWTIRGSDRIFQNGRPEQRASFLPGQYFNAGATRIPSTHRVILGYAKRLGLALEPFINTNRSAKWDFGGRVETERRMVADMRGRIGELLAKAIDARAFDGKVPRGELAALRQLLGPYAELAPDGSYVPRGSSGYAREGGAYKQHPIPLGRLSWADLAPPAAATMPFIFEHLSDMQATMLQPVGGMDRLTDAMFAEVRPSVRLGTVVRAIRRSGNRVRVELGAGKPPVDADYCVCTLPLPLLARIAADFSSAKKAAIAAAPPYLDAVKVAFEAPRFWEEEGIYGGLSWTDRMNENVIYPSDGLGVPRGVLIGAYALGWMDPLNQDRFSALSHDERFRISRASVEALHPGRSRLLRGDVTVSWALTPWSEGIGPLWGGNPLARGSRGAVYDELLKPERPIVFAGEHLSYQAMWLEGAATSAIEALKLVSQMATAA